MFNALLNSISVILRKPVNLSMLTWSSCNQYSAQYSFQATGSLTIVKTTDSSERGMNPVTMTHQSMERTK